MSDELNVILSVGVVLVIIYLLFIRSGYGGSAYFWLHSWWKKRKGDDKNA